MSETKQLGFVAGMVPPPAADVPPKHRRPLVSLADSCSPLSGALSGGFGSKTGTTVNPAAAGQERKYGSLKCVPERGHSRHAAAAK